MRRDPRHTGPGAGRVGAMRFVRGSQGLGGLPKSDGDVPELAAADDLVQVHFEKAGRVGEQPGSLFPVLLECFVLIFRHSECVNKRNCHG